MSYPREYNPDQEYAIIGIRNGPFATPLRPIAYLAQRSLGILGQTGYVPTYDWERELDTWGPNRRGIPHASLYGLDPRRRGGTLREERAFVEYLIKQTFPGSFTWQNSFWYRPQGSEHWYFYDTTDPINACFPKHNDTHVLVFIPCNSEAVFEIIQAWIEADLLHRFPSLATFPIYQRASVLVRNREEFDAENSPCLVHLASYPPTVVRYPPPSQRRRLV